MPVVLFLQLQSAGFVCPRSVRLWPAGTGNRAAGEPLAQCIAYADVNDRLRGVGRRFGGREPAADRISRPRLGARLSRILQDRPSHHVGERLAGPPAPVFPLDRALAEIRATP